LSSFNTGFSVANTWYNAMAVTVRRPFANGLEILGNYTWAHASDDGQVQGSNGTFYGGDTPTDPNNIRFDNGPSDIDIRSRGSISFVYQPSFKVGNMLASQLINGWQFSGTEIASGGEPIFLGVSGTIYSGNTSSSSYADESGIFGGAMSSSSGSATSGRPPEIGRNSIPMPGFNDLDMRVTRNFKIHENIALQTEFARKMFEIAVQGAQESASTARQSTTEAVKIIQARVKESFEEIRASARPGKSV